MNNIKFFTCTSALLLIIGLPSCVHHRITHINHHVHLVRPQEPIITPIQHEQHEYVTVCVHGTHLTAQALPLEALRNLTGSELGLNRIDTLHEKYTIKKTALELIRLYPNRLYRDDFYVFGWSGKLSNVHREQAAQQLYSSLACLIQIYQRRYGVTPKIRLITHSHGGNVALNLAKIQKNNPYPLIPLMVEELILLACPVQDITENYIDSPMFNSIYSLYSSVDLLQVGDPQGIQTPSKPNSLFSRRLFAPHKKLKQAHITMQRPRIATITSLAHADFVLPAFTKLLPQVIDTIDTWYQNHADLVTEPHKTVLNLAIKTK
jgi:hypothetical protein